MLVENQRQRKVMNASYCPDLTKCRWT